MIYPALSEQIRARNASAALTEVPLCTIKAYGHSNLLEMRVGSATAGWQGWGSLTQLSYGCLGRVGWVSQLSAC
jgi:hypothetical protein